MLITILLLLFTVVVLPIVSFFFGTPLTFEQRDILIHAAYLVAGVVAYCFVVGELTMNNSQVDKLWSIVPIVYTWYMTWLGGMNERMVLMAILVTIWGIRLTYNFARRGAYTWKFWSGEEDYRWEELRKRPGFNNRFVWMLFDLFFICAYQNTLIFLFTLPILSSLATNASPLGLVDILLAVLFVGFVVLEFIADQQQYDFQTEKHRRIKSGEELGPYEKGFVDSGLWAIVRHPNYACEQSIWIVFYLFSVVSTGEWINWSIAGCVLLLILFKGSSDFSEEISSRKYILYKDYQKRVPRFIPNPFRSKDSAIS
jgi:steroid 5-alpha reductase family enzyme